jgi:uncharacterized protein
MPKRALIRVVRSPDGQVSIDPKGKSSGRGAYLCPRPECFGTPRARPAVARALEVEVSVEQWAALDGDLRRLAAERGVGAVPPA